GVQKHVDHSQTDIFAGQSQSGDAVVVGGVHIGAGFQEEVDGVEVVPVCRPLERCGSVSRVRVDVDTLLHQRSNRLLVLTRHGLDQPCIGAAGGGGAADRNGRSTR